MSHFKNNFTTALCEAAQLDRSTKPGIELIDRALKANLFQPDRTKSRGFKRWHVTLKARSMFKKFQRLGVCQQYPQGYLRATFFLEAIARAVPQGQACAFAPVRGGHVQGPNLTHT